MLTTIQALLLGIIQGITEWLPVSSSGHLAIIQHYLNIESPIAFDVLLHLATATVAIIFLRKQIIAIIQTIIKRDFTSTPGKMFVFILISSIPTAIIGFTLQNTFEKMFTSMASIGAGLIITGILLLASKNPKENNNLNKKNSLIIGIFQGIAIAPGISRSGATITSALLSGIKKEEAVNYSFLLAIPAILGANAFKAKDLLTANIQPDTLIIGFLASLITGYLALILLKKIVLQKKLHWFSIYCIGLGAILFLLA